jgi:hypothetical protein
VLFHDLEFNLAQAAAFIQDSLADARLSNIVQKRADAEIVKELLIGKAELLGQSY